MTAKSVLVRPQGLRPRARASTCPTLATPLMVGRVSVVTLLPSIGFFDLQKKIDVCLTKYSYLVEKIQQDKGILTTNSNSTLLARLGLH